MSTSKQFAGCIDPQNGLQKYISTIGVYTRNIYGYEYDANNSKKEYTVLLVGASKCGKSTLIDCIANFFAGIKSKNINERFSVTRNDMDKVDITNTEDFCFYTFCTEDAVFNFIDSPSITNDLGFVDIKCKKHFEKFLKVINEKVIKVNAVGLVIQNHFVRLPPAEENMMASVTGLLAENINNIIPFITYADANTPPVLDALKAFQIDIEEHLVFNNVCFNPSIIQITEIEKICWKRGLNNVQKGINILVRLQPIDFPDQFPVGPRNKPLGDLDTQSKVGGTERAKKNKDKMANNEDSKNVFGGSTRAKKIETPKPLIDKSMVDPKKEFIGEISTTGSYTRNIYGSEYDASGSKKEYTVLLVGASKCGKSTLIDCIANFFAGIKSRNINERFSVTSNNTNKIDIHNTDNFCIYTFCTEDNVFNFIDSPSITNDLGFVDIKCKKHFEKFLKVINEKVIKVNAVGLVIQNHFVRLPPAEENMMVSVTGLLAENINNIIPFITYADANSPPVLDALKAFQIDTEKHLVFNNVCLNPSITQITEIEKICWRRGMDNIEKGINIIMSLEPISIPDQFPVGPRIKPTGNVASRRNVAGTEKVQNNNRKTANSDSRENFGGSMINKKNSSTSNMDKSYKHKTKPLPSNQGCKCVIS